MPLSNERAICWSGDYRREGETITYRFAEDDDVRNNILRFETPEVRAEAAEAYLDFVGDADTAGGVDTSVNIF